MKYDRLTQMKKLLFEQKKVTTHELCERFDVSIETVRRDLNILSAEGILKKVYGGAVLLDNNSMPGAMQDWQIRFQENVSEKAAIAAATLPLIPDSATIALDAGTSILELAKLFSQRQALTLITNCLHVAIELGLSTNHMTYCIGGALKNKELMTTGLLAMEFMNYFSSIDIAIFSCDGFSMENGILDHSVEMASIKRIMASKAKRIIAMVDHTKFSTAAFCQCCPLDRLDTIITSSLAPELAIQQLRGMGCTVIVAPVSA